jgi:hypothetical protein
MPTKAIWIVRSVVNNEMDRAPFDHWYGTDHMPKAIEIFGCERGWRAWSRKDPGVHYAFYLYPSVAFIEARDTRLIQALIDEFDTAWPNIPRERDLIELADAGFDVTTGGTPD